MRSKKIVITLFILSLFFFFPHFLRAQSDTNNVSLIAVLVIIGALILVSGILILSENLLQIEAQKYGVDTDKKNVSIFPALSDFLGTKAPEYTGIDGVFVLKKGFDILLSGKPSKDIFIKRVKRFAVRPPNFRGIAPIPKLVVAEGDEVYAGDELFFDKSNPDIKYCAPVSGEIIEIRRGAKRSISEVIILADKSQEFKSFKAPDINVWSQKKITSFLLSSGAWPLINERPFDVVPDPDRIPENVFVSTFDTAPLAPDASVIIEDNERAFQKGIDVLAKLTPGKVHLGLDAHGEVAPHKAFVNAKNAEKHWFSGKHPCGNVGVQIHHIDPIKPGKSVWTVDLQNVISIGRLFLEGRYDVSRLIAIGGSKVSKPAYLSTVLGANVGDLLGNIDEEDARIIAGDVLTGRTVKKDDFLDANTDQITVIEEGDKYEMFGWLLPLEPRPTISRTFPNFLFPSLKFDGNTNTHGEKRAFVITGEYEKVLPMNIYPQHLMKAILANDYEQMEGLGIYELSEEDIALCEFVCTSKMPLQNILRDGLEMMREQG